MSDKKLSCVIISDFNAEVFSGYLSNDEDFPAVNTIAAPFGQVIPILMQKDSPYMKGGHDAAVVWTRPDGVITSFKDRLAGRKNSLEAILSEVDQFADLLTNLSKNIRSVFVPAWVLPSFYHGLGMLDMKKDQGITNIIMQMNLRLAEKVDQFSNIYIMDVQRWIARAGKFAFNPRLWYRGKIAFGNDVYKEAVMDMKAALHGIQGLAKKLIILDLDNTLWGGVVGDTGWEHIVLGGHDPEGEAYADFQSALRSLMNRGILLGIVSKNEEAIALEAINRHPEMVLRLSDFAGWKINWQDKAQNIVDLVSGLNLGLQSAVFIDDNPAERARVRDTLPEVLVPEWPDDCMLYSSTLLGLRCFDTPSISNEDLVRARMYSDEQQRNESRRNLSSLDDWLRSLEIRILSEELNEVNLQRTAQLLNKTNQMNLTTRRMTDRELADWAKRDGRKLWTFRVSDKFGDSGLTGILSVETAGEECRIVDFVLSCRVIGRKVEEAMLYTAVRYALGLGLKRVKADLIPTAKNKPCLDFWKRSGFQYLENSNTFTWDLKDKYMLPDQVELVNTEANSPMDQA